MPTFPPGCSHPGELSTLQGDALVTLPEKVIDSSHASAYPFKRTVPYDFSDAFQEQPTQAQLRAKAQAYMNAAGVGVPKVSIKVSFVSLADTEEYKDVAALQNVNLCDNVGVYFEKLGISTTAEIVKVSYNVLLEKYDSVEIGSLRNNLAGAINANSQGITTLANNTRRMFKEYSGTVTELVDEATAWLTSGDGYVVATKDNDGNWKEILFMDTNDVETAHNVLRINQNGIGFSSTGVGGPYTQAWTLDGKLVIGGTNVPSLTVYDNDQNIIFQTSRAGTIWNSTNSSMSATGILRAVGAVLTNAQIISTATTGAGVDVNATNGEITFKWQGNDIATIVTQHMGSHTYLDITSDDYMSLNADVINITAERDIYLDAYEDLLLWASDDLGLTSETAISLLGNGALNLQSNNEVYLWVGSNNLVIDNNGISINATNINQSMVITGFDWGYDYDTGCINSLYDFVYATVWELN